LRCVTRPYRTLADRILASQPDILEFNQACPCPWEAHVTKTRYGRLFTKITSFTITTLDRYTGNHKDLGVKYCWAALPSLWKLSYSVTPISIGRELLEGQIFRQKRRTPSNFEPTCVPRAMNTISTLIYDWHKHSLVPNLGRDAKLTVEQTVGGYWEMYRQDLRSLLQTSACVP
jgi:hypothetical protein